MITEPNPNCTCNCHKTYDFWRDCCNKVPLLPKRETKKLLVTKIPSEMITELNTYYVHALQKHPKLLPIVDRLLIMVEEVGEVAKEYNDFMDDDLDVDLNYKDKLKTELYQVAVTALRLIKEHLT